MPREYTYFEPMPQHRFVERHLVTLAIEELAKDGWQLRSFEDEEHELTVFKDGDDHVEAWDAFDSVDMGWLHFDNTNTGATAWVLLIGGNGQDVLSDCTTNIDEPLQRVFLR